MIGCHSGFHCPTSNAIYGRFWADGTICLSCCLILHRSASHNFSLSIEFTSNRLIYYKTVVYRLYLAQIVSHLTYDLLHSNLDHFLHTNSPTYKFTYKLDCSTYEFTYLRTWPLFLRIHLLFHTIWCIPIWTTSYLRIPFLISHLRIHL